MKELNELVDWTHKWIDTVPKDIQLPAMAGFDRDWADEVLDKELRGD